MGVVSWLALVALVAYRIPTVSCLDDVILHVVSHIDDKDLLDTVTSVAMTKAAVTLSPSSPQDGECLESRPAEQKKNGLILITNSTKCKDVGAKKHRLLLVYNSNTHQFKTDKGESLNDTQLGEHLAEFVRFIDIDGKPVQQRTEFGICVPVWAIVGVGVLTGLLLGLSCIFFSKFRAATRKTHPIEKPNGNCSKGSSSLRNKPSVKKQKKGSSCTSKSSSSKSGEDSLKGTKKESCRSSKSLATKTCDISGPSSVKVISSVPPPKQKQNNASPPAKELPKDGVTAAMAANEAVLPVRDLDRRFPATVPKSCCGSTVPRPPVITTQPRPPSKGPPIMPTVSLIGYSPSPFAVLAQATSPLPPASTPAIFSSAPTAYSSPQTKTPTGHTSAPSTVSQQPSGPTVPTRSAPQTTVAPAATVSQSSVPTPTTTSGPQTTVAPAPPPIPLVSTVSLSSVVPVAVTPSPLPSKLPPVPSPSIHQSEIPISPAYSLASTPLSVSPSSSRERAPISKRTPKK